MNNIIENINISSIRQIISPEILKNRLKITDELKKQVVNYRNQISDIINKKNNKLIAIVGPCSVSNYESTLEYAEELKEISEHHDNILIIMRVYVEKPRTRTGWKGYLYDPDLNESNDINKGIELSRKLMLEITRLGLPIATEFLNSFVEKKIITESQKQKFLSNNINTIASKILEDFNLKTKSKFIVFSFSNKTDANLLILTQSLISNSLSADRSAIICNLFDPIILTLIKL